MEGELRLDARSDIFLTDLNGKEEIRIPVSHHLVKTALALTRFGDVCITNVESKDTWRLILL